MTKVIFRFRGHIMGSSDGEYFVTKEGSPQTLWYQNPIEAWNMYLTRIDIETRRNIGKWCAANGRDAYTGLKAKEKDAPTDQRKGVS